MDSKSKYSITMPEGCSEVTVREGCAPTLPDVREPEKISITGTLGAPLAWLQQRLGTFSNKEANIIVDREKMEITLTINETSFFRTIIVGRLEVHPKFREFGINSEKMWEPNQLGQFFKMNRSFFSDKTENAQLVSVLKTFNAKINSNIDKQKSDNGSFADNYSAVVESNVPGAFNVCLPVFKGIAKEAMKVEVYASIDGRNVKLSLVSPGANELVEEYRDKCIDAVLESIAGITTEIVIIEK